MALRKRNDLYHDRNKFVSFLFKLLLWLSYPFRRPLIFFPVLLLLYLAPTFAGVKPAEVHLWYWGKAKTGVQYAVDGIKNLWRKTDIDMSFIKSPFEPSGLDRLTEPSDNRPRSSKRQAFGQASGTPQAVDVSKQAADEDVSVPFFGSRDSDDFDEDADILPQFGAVLNINKTVSLEERENPLLRKPDTSYRRDIKGLVYLDEPKPVSGKLTVYDSNTIDIDGTYMILFGIYASPGSETGSRGKYYLRSIVEGKEGICYVVAYTLNKVPTAICYVGNANINKLMVIKGFSSNAAL